MLERYLTHLTNDGVLVVPPLRPTNRYRHLTEILQLHFGGKEAFAATDSPMSIFVCEARNALRSS